MTGIESALFEQTPTSIIEDEIIPALERIQAEQDHMLLPRHKEAIQRLLDEMSNLLYDLDNS